MLKHDRGGKFFPYCAIPGASGSHFFNGLLSAALLSAEPFLSLPCASARKPGRYDLPDHLDARNMIPGSPGKPLPTRGRPFHAL